MKDKLLTVAKVMEIIPLGRTSVTEIVKSLPHVQMGRKMMVYESHITQWIKSHTVYPKTHTAPKQSIGWDEETGLYNGLIPTRAQLRAMEKGVRQ